MNFKEIEFKYKADNISLAKFTDFCMAAGPELVVSPSGFDHFYDSPVLEGFFRHRVGPDTNQLTLKRKTVNTNNFIRSEHNIDLGNNVSNKQIGAICSELGFRYNTSIFKNSFVYKYGRHVLAYYVCYNADMNELGRFIEIEMSEEHSWRDEQEAWDELVKLEQLCKPLGISPQNRIKRSLFEMFRQER